MRDDTAADFLGNAQELLHRQIGAETRNAFELVDRAAGEAQSPAGHFRDESAAGCHNGRKQECGLVADAAGAVLVHGHAADGCQRQAVAGVAHGKRQGGGFLCRHALTADRHEPRGHHIIGDLAAAEAVCDPCDLVIGQCFAPSGFLNKVIHLHRITAFLVG